MLITTHQSHHLAIDTSSIEIEIEDEFATFCNPTFVVVKRVNQAFRVNLGAVTVLNYQKQYTVVSPGRFFLGFVC